MLPIWIINLTEDDADKDLLRRFIGSVTGQKKSCWYYTEVDNSAVVDGLESCKDLLSELVTHGRACYSFFKKQGYKITNFQVCIIGNASEERTRTCFQMTPLLLRSFMPAIWGEYVNRGLEITGVLFASCKINHSLPEERAKCALFFEELNTLSNDLKSGFYHRIVVCQEVQRPDLNFYPELDKRQIQELLFEILLHLFYVRNNQHKVLDLLSNSGFYSLGVASVYYDSREHKEDVLNKIFERLIRELKDPLNVSEKETGAMISEKFPRETIAAENMLLALQEGCQGLDVDISDLEGEPYPHPIFDFYKAKLYLSYYLDYLSFIPARAAEFTKAYSRLLFGKVSVQMKKNRGKIVEKYTDILQQYSQIFHQADYQYPTIAQLKATILALKERLSEEKEKVGKYAILEERSVFEVPDYLVAYYNECRTQGKSHTEKELLKRMKDALQSEPTILGLFSRCFILGTMMVFVFIPLLRSISPFIINLGNVGGCEALWIAVVFLSPFIFSGWKFYRHFLFVRKQKRILLAHALVKVQKKASAEIFKETAGLYSQLIAACESELQRYSQIERLLVAEHEKSASLGIPSTTFHQPIVGGRFMGKKLLKDEDIMALEIEYEGMTRKMSSMGKRDYLNLLKELFKVLGNNPFSSAEDSGNNTGELKTAITGSLSQMKKTLDEKIAVRDTHNISRLLMEISREDSKSIDLESLFAMAGVNGSITSASCEKGLVIRCAEGLDSSVVSQPYTCLNSKGYETEPVLFATYWSIPCDNVLDTRQICNAEPELPLSGVPFSSMMTCLFAKYKQKNNIYRIGKLDIPVSTGELEKLDMNINNIKL